MKAVKGQGGFTFMPTSSVFHDFQSTQQNIVAQQTKELQICFGAWT